jgi:hypothetical protein
MRCDWLAAILVASLTCLVHPAFGDTVSLKCSFVGLFPQDLVYNVNPDTKVVEVIGQFGSHEAVLFSQGSEGYYFIIEPNVRASVATIIYLRSGETPVGIRSTLGLVREDQFQGIPDELKLSSERFRFMAASAKGPCQQQDLGAQAPKQAEPKTFFSGEWGPWPSTKDSPLVSAGFKHDDGGADAHE